jgi:mRNA interferase RelE/StbE
MKQLYRILYRKTISKDLRKIPLAIQKFLYERITALASNPFPEGVQHLQGYKNTYRIRMGNYRIVYEVATTIRIITIVKVGHRKDVYRSF